MTRYRKGKSLGATLVESLVAVTVLALAISFVVSLIPSGALSQRRAERRVWAGSRADSLLAEMSLKAENFSARGLVAEETHANVDYQIFLTVSPVTGSDGVPLDKVRRIRVDVQWDEGERTFSISREATVAQKI